MMRWDRLGLFILMILPQMLYGKVSVSIGYGEGKPDSLKGTRVAIQDDWDTSWLLTRSVVLSGYWDYSIAYWDTHHYLQSKAQHDMLILGLAPVFRLQDRSLDYHGIKPYTEVSVGAAWMNYKTLGCRDLGAKFAFQNLLGFGLIWGKRQQLDLAYHFLHYSNASMFPPNQGIDVKYLLSFKYRLD